MQKQKQEIRDKIIEVSERLFFKNGFEDTSTREIAKAVDISVSNLYKYFENKEDIFDEIIKPFYTNYLINFRKFISHQNKDTFGMDAIDNLTKALFLSLKSDHIKFSILMDKSTGTKYSGFRNKVINGLEQHIKEGLNYPINDSFIIKILVSNFFTGIVEIAKSYKSDEWALENIKLLVTYHLTGISILYK